MNEPKRHHYIPEFFLKEFTENNKFYVYDRKLDKYTIQTPTNTTCIKYYYRVKGDYNFGKNMVEKLFSQIESRTKPVIEKIKNQQPLSDQDRYDLTNFISFLKTRVPFFEKTVNELENKLAKEYLKICFSSDEFLKKFKKRFEKEAGKKIDFDPKDIVKNYHFSSGKDTNLAIRLESSVEIAEYLFCMDWIFLFSHKNSSFILSDNPFIIIPPKDFNGIGILTPKALKVIPLTSNICLMICDYNPKGPQIYYKNNYSRKEIRKLNCNLAINCERFILSKDKPLLERIVKTTKINGYKINKRIEVNKLINIIFEKKQCWLSHRY